MYNRHFCDGHHIAKAIGLTIPESFLARAAEQRDEVAALCITGKKHSES